MDGPNNSGNLCCRALCWIFVFIFFVVGFFVVLVVVFSSHEPQFRVDSFSLSNFTLVKNDSATYMAAQVQLTARNPNKFVTLSFGRAEAYVYYRSLRSLGPAVWPPFSLGAKSQAPMTASFAAVVEMGGSNIGKSSVARFDLKLLSSVRYKEGVVWRRSNHDLTVFCEDLVVGIPSERKPGGLIGGGPRWCGVLTESS